MRIMNYNSILDIIINTLIPETKIAVEKGNKIFGAFVVKKSDLSFASSSEYGILSYHSKFKVIIVVVFLFVCCSTTTNDLN